VTCWDRAPSGRSTRVWTHKPTSMSRSRVFYYYNIIIVMDMSLFNDQFMVDALKTEIKVMKEM
jgi:hypothetical protein